jgi:ubiquinone/menaquinone biosynthesis C-methylase UbiE
MSIGYGKNWDPTENYKRKSVAESYDGLRFSSLAGRLFNTLEKRLIRRAFAGLSRTAVVGDVPCGTGRLAEELLEAGFTVVGVDISPAMLEVAGRRLARFGPKFRTETHDARDLMVQGAMFDAALCARVLMHFPLDEQIAFLRAVAAVTNGRLVFTQGLDTRYHRFRRTVKRLLGNQRPAVFPLTSADLAMLIREAGLREVQRYSVLPLLSEAVVVVTEKRAA